MKKNVLFILLSALLCSSCAKEFNAMYKTDNYDQKYEYAKQCFASGKYTRASLLLQQVVTLMKGTDNGQECLFMLAMSTYLGKDYETASQYFRKYYTSYPRGIYAEQASFYIGQTLYESTPEPRLDQTPTIAAIAAYQEFLDLFPDASIYLKERAHKRLFELQDKLVQKELNNARLYYDLGSYFGNSSGEGSASNYESCIITAQNAIKDFPYSAKREDFAYLIMKSKYQLATQSVESKKLERFRDAEDECYGFLNEYPDSEFAKEAEKFISVCKKHIKD